MNQKYLRPKVAYLESSIISCFICLLIVTVLLQTSDQVLHWFLIPVTLSGILIGIDAVDWLRGRFNTFDPIGILGLFGLHFFFLAPILHVSWNDWLETWYTPPPDWRPWLGYMAILNLLGLCLYRLSRNFGSVSPKKQPENTTVWKINQKLFPLILCLSLVFSAVLQILVYQKFGGLTGYIDAATDLSTRPASGQFAGMGMLFMLSESFPILAMMGFAVYAQKKKKLQTWSVLLIVFIVFAILQIFFGGLRGNRSNTLWGLFWAAGIIHFWIRPISKKAIAIGLVFILLFLYLYGFFKEAGLQGIEIALSGTQEVRADFQEKTGRTGSAVILDDLGRASIQAFLLYRLMRYDSDYEYAWGRTYFADASILVPSAIWHNKPPDKYLEGIRAEFGIRSYDPSIWISSKVYGLAGEAMLNFSPFSVPFSFILLGFVVSRVRRWLHTWKYSDTRLLLLPLLVNLCLIVLINDLDIDIFFLFKNGTLPSVLVFSLSSPKKIS